MVRRAREHRVTGTRVVARDRRAEVSPRSRPGRRGVRRTGVRACGGDGRGDDDDDDGDGDDDGDVRGGVADEGEGEGEWWSVRSMCEANDGAISVVGVVVGVVISRWLCRRWDTPRRRTVLGSSREPSRCGARGGDGGDDVG